MLIRRKRAYGPNGITLDYNRVEDWASCTNLLLSSRNVISTTSPLPSYAFFPHRRAAAAAAMSIPGNGHLPASTDLPDHSSSASDPEADYRPISAAATDSDTDTDPDPAPHHRLGSIGNGVSELDLDSGGDDDHCEGADGEDTVAEEEEGLGLGEEAARAFSEDERRRRARSPRRRGADRGRDARRGVPRRAASVGRQRPEDQWLDRLRSLRAGAGHPH